jgi:hypothetical protein
MQRKLSRKRFHFKHSEAKFWLFNISLLIINLGIPIISYAYIVLIPLPFILMKYLNLPKLIFKSTYVLISLSSLISFSLLSYFNTYNLQEFDSLLDLLRSFFVYVMPMNYFFWLGISLNFKKIPFNYLSCIIFNFFFWGGGVLFCYLSIAGSSLSGFEYSYATDFWREGRIVNFRSLDPFIGIGFSYIGLMLFLANKLFFSNKIGNRRYSMSNVSFFILLFYISHFIISVYLSQISAGRTFVGITVISLMSLLCFDRRKTVIPVKFMFLASLVFLAFLLNFVLDSYFAIFLSRFDLSNLFSGRLELWTSFFNEYFVSSAYDSRQVFSFTEETSYVHNLWLDEFYKSGFFSGLSIVVFHVTQIFILVKFIRLKYDLIFKVYFFCISISLLLIFMVTPMISASYSFFCVSCFFFGSLSRFMIDEIRYSRFYLHEVHGKISPTILN